MKAKINLPAIWRSAFIIFLVCNAFVLSAQTDAKTILTLKSGEKITGKVIEAVPDQYIKIELADGTVKTVQAADIQSMETEQASNKKKLDTKIGPSVIGKIGIGYDVGSGGGYVLPQVGVVGGFKVAFFRMGAGVGFIYGAKTAKDKELDPFDPKIYSKSLYMVPVYGNFHFDFGKKKIKPSVDLSIGYPIGINSNQESSTPNTDTYSGIDWNGYYYTNTYESTVHTITKNKGVVYANIGAGISYSITKKLMLNVLINYQPLAFNTTTSGSVDYRSTVWDQYNQVYDHYNDSYSMDFGNTKHVMHSLGVSVGIIY